VRPSNEGEEFVVAVCDRDFFPFFAASAGDAATAAMTLVAASTATILRSIDWAPDARVCSR
jgi:hypothetical protein